MDTIPSGWQKTGENDIGRYVDHETRASIHQYPAGSGCTGQFCAQVWRNHHGVSNVLSTLEEALRFTTEHLESHIAIFNRHCADDLIEEIRQRQKELIDLGCTETIDGYDVGHAAGRASAFSDLRKAIPEIDPTEVAREGGN